MELDNKLTQFTEGFQAIGQCSVTEHWEVPGPQNSSRGCVHYTVHLIHSAITFYRYRNKITQVRGGEAEFTFYFTALYFLLSMSFLYEAAYLRTAVRPIRVLLNVLLRELLPTALVEYLQNIV